jgi:hypothetical protein
MVRIPLRVTIALVALGALLALLPSLSQAKAAERPHGNPIKKARPIYDGLWRRKVSPEHTRWARRVATCETGRDPDALGAGGQYRGAFQFSLSTWRNAPQTPGGDPVAYSYRTQAFVAVRLMTRSGKGQWPNCG